jgi:hypothetical protein
MDNNQPYTKEDLERDKADLPLLGIYGARGIAASAIAALELAWGEVERLKVERDEADRRAGAAERDNAYLRDGAERRAQWLSEAKAEAGYNDSVSFDVVWQETRAKATANGKEIERLRASLSDIVERCNNVHTWNADFNDPTERKRQLIGIDCAVADIRDVAAKAKGDAK